MAAAFSFPPTFAVLVTTAGHCLYWACRSPQCGVVKAAYNAASQVAIVSAAAALYMAAPLGGELLARGALLPALPRVLAAICGYQLMDSLTMGLLMAFLRRVRIWVIWQQIWSEPWMRALGSYAMGLLGAVTWQYDHAALVLMVLPLFSLYWAFRLHGQALEQAASLRRRSEQLEVLLAAGREPRVDLGQENALQAIVGAAQRLSCAAIARGYLWDPASGTLRRRAAVGEELQDGASLAAGAAPDTVPGTRTLRLTAEPAAGGTAGAVELVPGTSGLAPDCDDVLGILALQGAMALENAFLHERTVAQAGQLQVLLSTVWAADAASALTPARLERMLADVCRRLWIRRLAIVLPGPLPGVEQRGACCVLGYSVLGGRQTAADPAELAAKLAGNDTPASLEPGSGWCFALRLGPLEEAGGWLVMGHTDSGQVVGAQDLQVLTALGNWVASHIRVLEFLRRRAAAEERLERIARLRVADNFHAIANRFGTSSELQCLLAQAWAQCGAGAPGEAAVLIDRCCARFSEFEQWYRWQNERYRRWGSSSLYGTAYRIEALARGFAVAYGDRLDFQAELAGDIDMPEPLPEHVSGLLESVVEEAVRNAVKHGGATRVRVRAERDRGAGMVQWDVLDNGRGIDPASRRAWWPGRTCIPARIAAGSPRSYGSCRRRRSTAFWKSRR